MKNIIIIFQLVSVFFLFQSAKAQSSYDFNQRLYPVASCSQIQETPIKNRSYINYDKSIEVVDINNDNEINTEDIQHWLNKGASLHKSTGNIYRVFLNKNHDKYYINQTLFIDSGVFLQGGENKTIIASQDFVGKDLIEFYPNVKVSGLHNIKLISNYKTTYGAVHIGEGNRSIYIYDNTFLDETSDNSGRKIEKGAGTNIKMIRLSGDVKNVFIDGNFFVQVPTGISITHANTRSINITHNTFSNWRQRAIYVKNVPGIPITDIRISHNRINPPKTGSIRQPIAFQAEDNSDFFERVSISYNNIYSPDLPHIWEKTINEQGEEELHSMKNNATADVISVHRAKNFNIIGNCLFNGGEAGISVTRSSNNGLVSLNYINGTDSGAISVGASPNSPQENVEMVSVTKNTIVNPSMNRDKSLPAWARSAIGFTNANNNYFNNNHVTENLTQYDSSGNTYNMSNFIYDFPSILFRLPTDDTNNTFGTLNTLNGPNHIKFYECRYKDCSDKEI